MELRREPAGEGHCDLGNRTVRGAGRLTMLKSWCSEEEGTQKLSEEYLGSRVNETDLHNSYT